METAAALTPIAAFAPTESSLLDPLSAFLDGAGLDVVVELVVGVRDILLGSIILQ